MTINGIYASMYAALGITFSAFGSTGITIMWSLIVCYCSPGPHDGPVNILFFLKNLSQRGCQVTTDFRPTNQFTPSIEVLTGDKGYNNQHDREVNAAIKQKFSAFVRSRVWWKQFRELVIKCVVHNMSEVSLFHVRSANVRDFERSRLLNKYRAFLQQRLILILL